MCFLLYLQSMEHYDKWNYWLNIGISLDKLGNSISGGSHKVTISARTGKHANTPGAFKTYWKLQESIINFAFHPVDGPDHCHNAYKKEREDTEVMREGNPFLRGILAIIVLTFCILIGTTLRIIKPISRLFKKINLTI